MNELILKFLAGAAMLMVAVGSLFLADRLSAGERAAVDDRIRVAAAAPEQSASAASLKR